MNLVSLLFACLLSYGNGDFIFNDFNLTRAIKFNGAAGTTSCVDLEGTRYGTVQGKADQTEFATAPIDGESLNVGTRGTTTTDDPETTEDVANYFAGFGHRDEYRPHKSGLCSVRCRLNPSGPSTAGSIWYHIPLSVMKGFETIFTFQVFDHSRECSQHRDPAFSTQLYKSCSVHGGDGFAFVIQRDKNDSEALGASGGGLGYEGIENSLAVEFDTWYNPTENTTAFGSDIVEDHISVHSRSTLPNSASESFALSPQRIHPIADGAVHIAKVTYLPELADEYFDKFSATSHAFQFMKDNNENRRMGTLLVFVDQGIEDNDPLIAIPINLSVLLRLPQDQAYVGFTGSTGLRWEKHDIISWIWCDKIPCDSTKVADFDYNQESKFSAAAHYPIHRPPKGYGATVAADGEARPVASPDPVSSPKKHFATQRKEGLFPGAKKQVPPEVSGERFGTEI